MNNWVIRFSKCRILSACKQRSLRKAQFSKGFSKTAHFRAVRRSPNSTPTHSPTQHLDAGFHRPGAEYAEKTAGKQVSNSQTGIFVRVSVFPFFSVLLRALRARSASPHARRHQQVSQQSLLKVRFPRGAFVIRCGSRLGRPRTSM